MSPNQPKTPVVTLRLDDERRARVDAEAERRGITRSDVIRELIDEQLPSADQD